MEIKNKKNIFELLPIVLTGCGLGIMTLSNGWKMLVNNQFKDSGQFNKYFWLIDN